MESRGRSVSQKEIEILIGLEGLIRQRWEIYEKEARAVVRELAAGVPVEPGEHTARIRKGRGGEAVLVLDKRRALPPMKQAIGKRTAESVLRSTGYLKAR